MISREGLRTLLDWLGDAVVWTIVVGAYLLGFYLLWLLFGQPGGAPSYCADDPAACERQYPR